MIVHAEWAYIQFRSTYFYHFVCLNWTRRVDTIRNYFQEFYQKCKKNGTVLQWYELKNRKSSCFLIIRDWNVVMNHVILYIHAKIPHPYLGSIYRDFRVWRGSGGEAGRERSICVWISFGERNFSELKNRRIFRFGGAFDTSRTLNLELLS